MLFSLQPSGRNNWASVMNQPLRQPLRSDGAFGFSDPIGSDGYRWWYIDGFSECGQYGATVIAFIGSVFSPYYARARRIRAANPNDFCSINVILYGPRHARWAMTERASASLSQSEDSLVVGPSALRHAGQELEVLVKERTTPWMQPLEGTIRLSIPTIQSECFALDDFSEHRWWPIAPSARISVEFTKPAVSWQGSGYFDSNAGVVPLEQTFSNWHWSRSHEPGGGGRITYETHRRNDSHGLISFAVGPDNTLTRVEALPRWNLPKGPVWRVDRPVRAQSGATVLSTLEDTPFYTRSQLRDGDGHSLVMHESLDLDRFSRRWVQCLLPFRMPRLAMLSG
jgi:carotenoid 1,2-hydratase